ncbi:MAG: hypothetical protein KDD73_09275 [Anaerolineales bacterium]|nr:hypothetical protein [Anaerolineales bacterium]MCB9127482.1 hypothetical protein [Ardenticatenales bacterium]
MNRTIVDFEGVYGGVQSREIVLRMLKEALALVENTHPQSALVCSSFRIEEEPPEA